MRGTGGGGGMTPGDNAAGAADAPLAGAAAAFARASNAGFRATAMRETTTSSPRAACTEEGE